MGVIIGMDPHKRSATVEVDERGAGLAKGRFGTDKVGCVSDMHTYDDNSHDEDGQEPARGSRWTVDCIKFCGDQLPLRCRLRAHIALMPQRQCGAGVVSRQQPRLQVRRQLDMRLDP